MRALQKPMVGVGLAATAAASAATSTRLEDGTFVLPAIGVGVALGATAGADLVFHRFARMTLRERFIVDAAEQVNRSWQEMRWGPAGARVFTGVAHLGLGAFIASPMLVADR